MISSIVICQVFTGLSIFCMVGPPPLAPETKQELQKRGLDVSFENVCLLADEAFAMEDKALLMALINNFFHGWKKDQFGDKILALYRIQPDTEFKKKMSLFVACGLSRIERIAQSKYGCEFYSLAVGIMLDPYPQTDRMYALMCIDGIFPKAGSSPVPYYVKMLLVLPRSDMIVLVGVLPTMKDHFSEVTPEMAYHVYKQYQDEEIFQNYKKAYEEKANLLLNAPALPESASRENLIKQLDESIAETGRKFIETYKDVEPKPYTPPPPSNGPGTPSALQRLDLQKAREHSTNK